MQRVGRVSRVSAVALGVVVAMVACSKPPGTSVEAATGISGGPETVMTVASYPRHPNVPRSRRRRPHRKRSGAPATGAGTARNMSGCGGTMSNARCPTANWIPGYWEQRPEGWMWVEGRWIS
jgi:hypothetical protein